MEYLYNNQRNKHLRSKLRINSTEPERRLWWYLRNNQISHRFRRQFGIGPYIVDFFCPALKLVIEVDGAHHNETEVWQYDCQRQQYLESVGCVVKRYSATEVLIDTNAVVDSIYDSCENLQGER